MSSKNTKNPLELTLLTVCSLSINQRTVEHYGMDLTWASRDLVFSLCIGKSSCTPLLKPQFAHLLNGVIVSAQ